jgi:vanillate O-demethylase ferredoxin subunit
MDSWNSLSVSEIASETPLIRTIELRSPDGERLPGWTPGAHVKIRLPGGDDRSYSLVNLRPEAASESSCASYRLGVRLESPSKGGSTFMHGLQVGDRVSVSAPTNNFPLERSGDRITLVAGGIGITPIASMISALMAENRPFRAFYAGRSEDQLAYSSELAALAGERLRFHFDDRSGVFDIRAVMEDLRPAEPIYVCGPRPMIDTAIAVSKEMGWAQGRLRFEIFAAADAKAGDGAFEVVLASSGRSFMVPPDKSILDVLIEAGIDAMHDCRRGDCGICQTAVLEGVPDHRDYILSESEQAAGKLMQICVSRAKTPRLVLDL